MPVLSETKEGPLYLLENSNTGVLRFAQDDSIGAATRVSAPLRFSESLRLKHDRHPITRNGHKRGSLLTDAHHLFLIPRRKPFRVRSSRQGPRTMEENHPHRRHDGARGQQHARGECLSRKRPTN